MVRGLILFFLLIFNTLIAQEHVLAIAGSTREKSLNKQLLNEAVELAQKRGAKVRVFDLSEHPMPLYDGDLELRKGLPKNARALKREMLEADLIIIASPEYNGSIPAVLKNAIDWASRSEKASFTTEAFKKKRFFLISASPGQGGGARALKHLKEILTNLGAEVTEVQVSVGKAQENLGNKEAPYYQKLKSAIDQLIKQKS